MTSTFSRGDAAPFVIERAGPDDAAQLATTAAVMFEQTFGSANTPEDMAAYIPSAFSEERQRRDLERAENRIWLARGQDGRIAGYAHVKLGAEPPGLPVDGRSSEIVRLYADQRWHGRGLGAALMRACIETGREHGDDRLWLGVWEHNARAIAFYEKHGFRVIGEQPFTLGADRQRDLVMALDLASRRA